MPGRRSVPPQLLARPFTLAEATAAGLSLDVLRGRRFWTPVRGVRASTDLGDDLALRCRAVTLVVPDAVVSHASAATLLGMPLPACEACDRVEVTRARLPPRLRGVRGHVGDVGADVITLPDGLRVTSGARTWADPGSRLEVDDLVVAGDALLRKGVDTRRAMAAMAARPGRRGSANLRQALPLVDPRSDSPMETRVRLLIVRAAAARCRAGRRGRR